MHQFCRSRTFVLHSAAICVVVAFIGWHAAVRAATVELVDGEKIIGTASCSPDGKLVVAGTNGQPRTMDWKQVRVARFTAAAPAARPLPRGWHEDDIGRVSGAGSDSDGAFTLSVNGAELREGRYQSLHFARHLVRGEPIVVARITEVTGQKPAAGGVMLRENLEPSGAYALLGVTADRHLRFEARDGSWSTLHSQSFGPVPLPIWLKLERAEKEGLIKAYRSADGKRWEQVATGKLAAHVEPYPESGGDWRPIVYAGVAIMAATNDEAAACLKCDHAAIAVRGFMAEYFQDETFTKLAFARPDRHIEFWWADRSPAPSLEPEHFSVRWHAQIEPKYSENYRFYYDPEGTRLLIEGQPVAGARWNENRRHPETPRELALVAGRKYDMVLEFAKSREAKTAKLGWASRSQSREIIPATAATYTFGPTSPDEEAQATNVTLAAGAWLRSGTFLAGEVVSADGSSTRLSVAGGKPLTLLNHRLARLVLRTARNPLAFEVAGSRTGIFLSNGDFLEGDFDEVTARSVVVSSVLFGRRTYARDSSHALAVVLNPMLPASAPLEVKLKDGSVIRARGVRGASGTVSIDEVAVGELRFDAAEVEEIRSR